MLHVFRNIRINKGIKQSQEKSQKYHGKNLLVQAEYIPCNSQKVMVDILTICGYFNGAQ